MSNAHPRELVVFLHGILRSKTDMLALEKYLKIKGYDAINILYPSRKKSLEELSDFVKEKIEEHPKFTPDKTLNFVTHSMGGLITRYYIATYKPENLGKVVMLGPPNKGSEFADFLKEHKLLGKTYRKFFGPAGSQLTTTHKHIDTEINYPLGIIAGCASINPLAPWVLKGKHDGIVPVERTKIKDMTDHIVIKSTHSLMMFNPLVMRQAYHFLKYSKFIHEDIKLQNKELVILLHGIANPSLVMTPIELFLQDEGYETLNIDYPSQSENIARLSKYIHKALRKKKYRNYKKVHFVAFSLGGLIVRNYLSRVQISNMGRVVMLGTPNRGTEAASHLKDNWYYKLFFGPAGQEVCPSNFSDIDPIPYELGIIAGTQSSLSPANILMKDPLPTPNDGMVSVQNTKINGMKDHITFDINHPGLITTLDVQKAIRDFLKTGKFNQE